MVITAIVRSIGFAEEREEIRGMWMTYAAVAGLSTTAPLQVRLARNRTHRRLQPHAPEAATPRNPPAPRPCRRCRSSCCTRRSARARRPSPSPASS
eukprot:scaffold124640_cov42-Phaeocystis_antarctica.AAC.1